MRQIAYISLALLVTCSQVFSQDKKLFKKTFLDAEYFLMIEEYHEALHHYNELLKVDPENANLHFMTGACYLSLYGEKEKAILHLERAISEMSTGYREGSYKERNAPREALFALARAYHINNDFDKAIENYEKYKNIMFKRHFADIEYVNHQIKSCELAKSMISRPLAVQFLNMGEDINRFSSNYNPVVSRNDSVIIYMTDRPLYRAIMESRLTADGWTEPEVINEDLGSDGDCYPTSLSFDGNELYLVKRNFFESNIYVARKKNGNWTLMEELNRYINTDYYESHASISLDGTKLLITSDRPGGQGAADIWMSERPRGGEWGPAVNMGPKINSFYNEASPFFTENGRKIFFSSQGHATMGGFDVFVCERLPDAGWSFPRNMGYPISSSDDDIFYVPRKNGWNGYFSTIHDSIAEGRNIYAIRIVPSEDVQIAVRRQDDVPVSGPGSSTIVLGTDTSDTVVQEPSLPELAPPELGPPEPDEYFVLNSILFDFDSDRLNESARSEADRVLEVLHKHPEIRLELTGHTDDVGSEEYNLDLSQRRAQSIADYLISEGIEESRIQVKGAGEAKPIAINTYEDGSDSPDGRRLNRQVSIKLQNLQDENVQVAETFVPDDLRPKHDQVFTVLLVESEHMLDTIPERVEGEQTALIITDESFLYTAGDFNLKPNAMKYLNEVIDKGYPDANMMEVLDLERLVEGYTEKGLSVRKSYTIQIMALKNPVDVGYFKPLSGIVKYTGKDGLHRYVHGEYTSISEALGKLPAIKEMGYHDAFIMSVFRYKKISE